MHETLYNKSIDSTHFLTVLSLINTGYVTQNYASKSNIRDFKSRRSNFNALFLPTSVVFSPFCLHRRIK